MTQWDTQGRVSVRPSFNIYKMRARLEGTWSWTLLSGSNTAWHQRRFLNSWTGATVACLPANMQITFLETNLSPFLSSTCPSLGRGWYGRSCTVTYCNNLLPVAMAPMYFSIDASLYLKQDGLKILKTDTELSNRHESHSLQCSPNLGSLARCGL